MFACKLSVAMDAEDVELYQKSVFLELPGLVICLILVQEVLDRHFSLFLQEAILDGVKWIPTISDAHDAAGCTWQYEMTPDILNST